MVENRKAVKAARVEEVHNWLVSVIKGLDTTATQLAVDADLAPGTIARFLAGSSHSLSDLTMTFIRKAALAQAKAMSDHAEPKTTLINKIQFGPGECHEHRAEIYSLLNAMSPEEVAVIMQVAEAMVKAKKA